MEAGHVESCCHTEIAYLGSVGGGWEGPGRVGWLAAIVGSTNIPSQIKKRL